PPALVLHPRASHDYAVAGFELRDALEHRARRRHRHEREVVIERLDVHLARDGGMLEERSELRREHEEAGGVAPVERLDADAVAREEEPIALRVPDREREHALEVVDAVLAALLVEPED